jgi:acyl carrier protein
MIDIPDKLNGVFREVFRNSTLTVSPQTTAADIPKWDSFTHMTLLARIEQEFNVSFSFNEVSSFRSVGDILTALKERLG